MTGAQVAGHLALHESWQKAEQLERKTFIKEMRYLQRSEGKTRDAWSFFHVGWVRRGELKI